VRYKGRPVFTYRTKRSGVTFNGDMEHALAARWWGWRSVDQFYDELSSDEQARCIAVYRIQMQIDGVMATEQINEQRRSRRRRA
jgi:hypothetical protein